MYFNNNDSWVILNSIEQNIKAKIEAIGKPLKDWDISINRGILTGYNEAFIISGEKKKELIAKDPKSAEIIRPILRGRDIKRYSYNFADLWLINVHNGIKEKHIDPININDYPAIKEHLDQYSEKLEKRADKGNTPYNLRNCVYMDDFSKQKIIWKRIGSKLRFSYDSNGCFCLDSTCFATGKNVDYLAAVLNTSLGCYLLKDSPKTGTGDLIVSVQALAPALVAVPDAKTLNKCVHILQDIIQYEKHNHYSEIAVLESELENIIFDLYNINYKERKYIEDFVQSNFR